MNVRSSTRPTSRGSDRARYELGRLASDSRSIVPASTSRLAEAFVLRRRTVAPVDGLGRVSSAIPFTHASNRSCIVWATPGLVAASGRTRHVDPAGPPNFAKSLSGVLAWSNSSATAGKALKAVRAGCGVMCLSGPRCEIEPSIRICADGSVSSGAPPGRFSVDRLRCVTGPGAKHRPSQGARRDRPDWPSGRVGARATVPMSLAACGSAMSSLTTGVF